MNPYENQPITNFRFEEDFKNIQLNLIGTGALYEDPHFHYSLVHDITWRRPAEISNYPVFINGKPSRFDVLQGGVGDCWLASAIGAITLNEQLVQHVVPPDQSFDHNYIGAFHFRIWKLGTWVDVVVDDRLPTYSNDPGKLCYMHSLSGNVYWAALLEKAYAKVYGKGSYYDDLGEGYTLTSYQDLSGGIVETLNLHKISLHTIAECLLKDLPKNTFASCITYTETSVFRTTHFYTITKIYKFSASHIYYPEKVIVRVMNPWGHTEWTGDWGDTDYDNWDRIGRDEMLRIGVEWREDGEFWMPLEKLTNFDRITLCYLGPGQYLSTHQNTASTQFSERATEVFYGEWVVPFSAVGPDVNTRHKNPQYLIELKCPDDNKGGKCRVVIEVTHRSKIGRDYRPRIAFFIYYLKPSKKIAMPLRKKFFLNNEPMDKKPNFSKSNGRSYVTSMELQDGKYCIVPCTAMPNAESNFLLRIYAEGHILTVVADSGGISKSAPTEDVEIGKHDYKLRQKFDVAARGQNEIDWTGLKEVLDEICVPKYTYFWLVRIFINIFRIILGVNIPLLSSDTDIIVFTKNECRSMITMLDDDHSGKLNFSEFINLWNKICFWKKVYYQHIDETEGCVTVVQLRDAISSIGFNIPERTVHSVSYVFADDAGKIRLTDFILCGVTLETALFLFQKKNLGDLDDLPMTLEDWLKNTLIL